MGLKRIGLLIYFCYMNENIKKEKTTEKTGEEIFFEIHKDIPRQGPGNEESTKKAFSLLSGLPSEPAILDVGSGPGLQTIELARLSGGNITALDYHQEFLDELNLNASKAGLGEHIKETKGSMFEMPFGENNFDVIWSEGAIYIIGFEKGLKEWKPFIKDGGYMVASHISWLKKDVSEKPRAFWEKNYPAIDTVENNLQIAQSVGYNNIGHFTLPEAGWWDGYYGPMEENLKRLRVEHQGNESALAKIASTQEEIDLYRNFADCYGYVFYVLQKN